MGLTERQAQAQLYQHALEEEAKASTIERLCARHGAIDMLANLPGALARIIIDFFNAVEQLHGLELNKIIPKLKADARWAQVPRSGKTPSKISVVKLIRGLPVHIMGSLIAKLPNPNDPVQASLTDATFTSANSFQHASKAFQLLSTLSYMCIELPPLRDNGTFGPDPQFTAELVDAVNLALLGIAGPEADNLIVSSADDHSFQNALGLAELVPAALRAVALIASAHAPPSRNSKNGYNWWAVSEAILAHPRGAVLLDAAFEASRVLIRAVREALCRSTVSGDNVYNLAYSAGAAVELVTALCACPLFYHRLMLHDPQGASPLRLILSCLAIHDAPLAAPPFSRMAGAAGAPRPVLAARQPPYATDKGRGAAELLAARGFALLLLLSEYENPTYLDEVFRGKTTRALAEQLVGRSAAYVGQILLRPPTAQFPSATGEGQMAINVLRAAELLSDDSNFRVALIPGLAPTMAQLLAFTDPARFRSMWCLGEEAVRMMGLDSNLLVNSSSQTSLELVDTYAAASKEYHHQGLGLDASSIPGLAPELVKMGRHLALERAVLLSKLLINLHYYDDTLPVGLKDSFFNALIAAIKATARDPATRAAAMSKAAKNLESVFRVAWEFGPPDALKDIELMAEVDMDHSVDLFKKMKAAADVEQMVLNATAGAVAPGGASAAGQGARLSSSPGGLKGPPGGPSLITSGGGIQMNPPRLSASPAAPGASTPGATGVASVAVATGLPPRPHLSSHVGPAGARPSMMAGSISPEGTAAAAPATYLWSQQPVARPPRQMTYQQLQQLSLRMQQQQQHSNVQLKAEEDSGAS